MQRITVRLQDDTAGLLTSEAAEHGVTMAELARKIIVEHFSYQAGQRAAAGMGLELADLRTRLGRVERWIVSRGRTAGAESGEKHQPVRG